MELEATLVILSQYPDDVINPLQSLARIGPYSIEKEFRQIFRDSYFDTADRRLGSGRWALRLRQTDEKRIVALKGPATEKCSVIVRQEIEGTWSKSILWRILQELRLLGIDPTLIEDPGDTDPEDWFTATGFHIVQKRQTQRCIRNIFSEDRILVAELDIDRVTYSFESTSVVHDEIEIEAKIPRAEDAIQEMAARLLEGFGQNLHPWRFSKFELGMALAKCHGQRMLENMVRPDNHLKLSAYSGLEQIMIQSRTQ
jgi:inorganic triphosphatase YgiF